MLVLQIKNTVTRNKDLAYSFASKNIEAKAKGKALVNNNIQENIATISK